MSVQERLDRLLYIVPYVTQRDGVPFDELATELGLSRKKLEEDLDLLTMVGRPPLTPDHLIDIYVEDDVVYVDLDQRLCRPLRLSRAEAKALVLGIKLVGHLLAESSALDAVVKKITSHFSASERTYMELAEQSIALAEQGDASAQPLQVLRQAVQMHRLVELKYFSASRGALCDYKVKPLGLLAHSGFDYVLALDCGADDKEKLYRLDRIAGVSLLSESFDLSDTVDLERFRQESFFQAVDKEEVMVRFAPSWKAHLAEHFAKEDMLSKDDGFVEVAVSTASIPWLVSWVLAFGQDAEIIAAQAFRKHARDICAQAASMYKETVELSWLERDEA
jgi:proteasome accessory factor C